MNTLKKLMIALGLVFFVASCSDNLDGGSNFALRMTPIVGVDIPDTVQMNHSYVFKIKFEKPSDCYRFSGFDYRAQTNTRYVGAVSAVMLDEQDCRPYDTPKIVTDSLDFFVTRPDYYTFKFWQGTDSLGQAKYLTKKVIVAPLRPVE